MGSLIIDTTIEPQWLIIARAELGQSEILGNQDNPRIIEYLKSVALPVSQTLHDEISWCAAFINFCLSRSGIQGTHSPAARAFMNWGIPLKKPQAGAITIFSRGNSSWQGHVTLYLETFSNGRILCLGGNQGDKVCVESFPTDQLLGYRWPNK